MVAVVVSGSSGRRGRGCGGRFSGGRCGSKISGSKVGCGKYGGKVGGGRCGGGFGGGRCGGSELGLSSDRCDGRVGVTVQELENLQAAFDGDSCDDPAVQGGIPKG